MKIRTVLFDLDGTLVDSSSGIEYSAAAAIAAIAPEKTISSLRSHIGPPIREIFKSVLGSVEPAVLAELESRFRLSYDAEGWQQFAVYDGVVETLAQLHKLNVDSFLVTNKPTVPTGKILNKLQLMDYFTQTVSLDSRIPPFASKAEAVSHVVAKNGVDVRLGLLVGDSVEDARAAQECGLPFAAFAPGYGKAHLQEQFPVSYVLSDFSELLHIVSP